MNAFDKTMLLPIIRKMLKELPDGSKGPEDMFACGACYMFNLMQNQVEDLQGEIDRLKAALKRAEEAE